MKINDIVFTYRYEEGQKIVSLYLVKKILPNCIITNKIIYDNIKQTYELNTEPIQKISYEPGFILTKECIDSIPTLKNIFNNLSEIEMEEKCLQDSN